MVPVGTLCRAVMCGLSDCHTNPCRSCRTVVSLSYPVGNLLSFCRTRAQAFLNPTVAMEKDFEGLTEKDLEELERSALAQVAADRAA